MICLYAFSGNYKTPPPPAGLFVVPLVCPFPSNSNFVVSDHFTIENEKGKVEKNRRSVGRRKRRTRDFCQVDDRGGPPFSFLISTVFLLLLLLVILYLVISDLVLLVSRKQQHNSRNNKASKQEMLPGAHQELNSSFSFFPHFAPVITAPNKTGITARHLTSLSLVFLFAFFLLLLGFSFLLICGCVCVILLVFSALRRSRYR